MEFGGFKRLLQTGCNLDDRLIAFVGPNEAGKSTVLHGLAWLEASSNEPLAEGFASRGQDVGARDGDDKIVSVKFRLEPTDLQALSQVARKAVETAPVYHLYKLRNGSRYHQLLPRFERDPSPFTRALKSLGKAPRALEDALAATPSEVDDGSSPMRTLHDQCRSLLEQPDRLATEEEVEFVKEFSEWLAEVAEARTRPSLRVASEALAEVAEILDADHPNAEALAILDARRPRFREFDRADRDLETEFNVLDPDETPSSPLLRVLGLAHTNIDHLRRLWADESARDTHLGECNAFLGDFFQKAWTQSSLSIYLKAEAHLLKVQVTVVEDGKTYYSTFGERSDGLKAFVALVGFLHSLSDEQPPILLIDEAETHLHLDAQADLIQLLQDRVAATQIFYTTHSPGCLPLDLGRGLRFVEPTEQHYSSVLSHNFWDSRHPGFSSVLFKMGASAFAFSALRKAVLAEGAADMVLLPKLLRDAIDQETLEYQVAPRMNDFDESERDRHEISARVAYLVDGDQGGRDRRKYLRRKYGVAEELIVSHSAGFAVEDYVDPSAVLDVVNDLRTDAKRDTPVKLVDLPAGETLGQRIDRWFASKLIYPPGKVAVATRLANTDDLRLRSGSKAKLRLLHSEILEALGHRTGSG